MGNTNHYKYVFEGILAICAGGCQWKNILKLNIYGFCIVPLRKVYMKYYQLGGCWNVLWTVCIDNHRATLYIRWEYKAVF